MTTDKIAELIELYGNVFEALLDARQQEFSQLEAENKRLLTENKELCEELGIEWTQEDV